MTLAEMMAYKGRPSDFQTYSDLIDKKNKLKSKLNRLMQKVYDEDDSLSVFEGELNDHDKELFDRHVKARKDAYAKWYQTQGLYELTLRQIQDINK